MKTIRKQLISAGVVCLTCLPFGANAFAADGGSDKAADSLPAMIAASGGNWQMVLDTVLEQAKTAPAAPGSASQPAQTPEAIGKQVDALLIAAEKAKTAEKPDEYYAASWKLLRVLPEMATRTADARLKIAAVSPAVKQFLKDVDAPLAQMTEACKRFHEKLGLRTAEVDAAVSKLGVKGEVNTAKGAPVDGEIALTVDPAAPKPSVTDAEKAQIAGLETAFVKLLAADHKKISEAYPALWMNVVKALPTAWYFQTLYKADAKIGEADPETLKFLRSLHHGLGDLSRYETLAPELGLNLNQLDAAAGLTAENVGGADGVGIKNGAPGVTGVSGEVLAADVAPAGGSTPHGAVGANGGNGGNGGTGATGGATGGGSTVDATVNGETAGSGKTADADDWQAKLDAQLKKDAPAATQATPTSTVSLDKNSQQLASNIQKSTQKSDTAKAERTVPGAQEFFKAQWQLLRLLPETAYKATDTRKALEAENTETKAFLTNNAGAAKTLSELFIRFKQRLGLRSAKVDQMARRMGVKGNIDESKGAANQAGTSSGDISLDAVDPKAANTNLAQGITTAERYKMQSLEGYLKRISAEEKINDTANGEADFKNAAKNLDGAYFFQVLYKDTPGLASQYPEILKFLQSLNGGLGDLRAYQNLLEQRGWTIDDNGDLVRGDGTGDPAPADGAPGPGPGPGSGPGPGNFPRGGGGGGGRGGRGGRGR